MTTPVQKIFVVAQTASPTGWGAPILKKTQSDLVSKLKHAKVAVEMEPFDPVSLTSKAALEEKIRTFAPDVVATLSVNVDQDYYSSISTFDLQIEDYRKKELLWRGQVVSNTGLLNHAAPKVAKKFYNKMEKDAVIPAR